MDFSARLQQVGGRNLRGLAVVGEQQAEDGTSFRATAAAAEGGAVAEFSLLYRCDCLEGFVPIDGDYYSCSPAVATAGLTDNFLI
jgi:hypothetical protein